jgi:hypothetical protein
MMPKVTQTPTDAEIEAIVADALAAEAAMAISEAQPPSSAIVWWRAQMRARREATELAQKPITIVQSLSIAAGAGLMLSLVGSVIAIVKGSSGWLSNISQSIAAAAGSMPALSLTTPWVAYSLTGMLITVVVASVAAYVIYSDE